MSPLVPSKSLSFTQVLWAAKAKIFHVLRLQIKAIRKAIKPFIFRIYPFRLKQYVGNNQLVIRTKYGFPVYCFGDDMSVSFTVILTGIWEPQLTSIFYQKVKPGMIAIDIGANIGYFSALFASCGAHVHAFEPNPAMSQIIYKNIFINNVFSIITKDRSGRSRSVVNQCAVGESRGTAKMDFNPCLTASNSLELEKAAALEPIFREVGETKSVEVDIITLDEYSRTHNLQSVDIIKIDIEGFEERALKGAESLICRSPNLMLCMEYTRGCYSSDFVPLAGKIVFQSVLAKIWRED